MTEFWAVTRAIAALMVVWGGIISFVTYLITRGRG